jgi:hypothetical protein
VSQPFNRGARIPQPGDIDHELHEFWVDSPWMIQNSENLSAFERNRTFLNFGGEQFVEISYLAGNDSEGDGRSVVAADFRNNGQLDLVVRQVGGGALLLFENQFPKRHYLKVSLRGTRSNRLGIGSRLTARVDGRHIVRELFPHNSFQSQMPSHVHFGLGDAQRVDSVKVRWPSGLEQEITDVAADQHVVIQEGSDAVEVVVPGQTIAP